MKCGRFAVLLGRLRVASGGMELGPRRSQEFRSSPELQNGGLRALLLDGQVLDTSGDVSGGSGALRVTPRRLLQTRRPETGQSFSDRVRAGLQNAVPKTLFWLEKHHST